MGRAIRINGRLAYHDERWSDIIGADVFRDVVGNTYVKERDTKTTKKETKR